MITDEEPCYAEAAYDAIVVNINALEQAIEEVCDKATIAKIRARKRELEQE